MTDAGHCTGRGPRAAALFDDLIQVHGNISMKSIFLFEGVNGWATAGDEYVDLMSSYKSEVWQGKVPNVGA